MAKQTTPVSKNQQVELDITAINSQGQGVGRVEGYALFVPLALQGERVRAHVIKAGKKFGVAKLVKVMRASKARVEPKCPVFGRCGGCSLQHLSYEGQLAHKRQVIEDAFARIGGMTVKVPPVLGMDEPWQYRNKAAFLYGWSEGAALGFYAANTHRLVPNDGCPLQDERINKVMRTVRAWAQEQGIGAYDENDHTPVSKDAQSEELRARRGADPARLRHVVARVGNVSEGVGAGAVCLVATRRPDGLAGLAESLGEVDLIVNINDEATNVIFGERFETVRGNDRLAMRLCGLDFDVSMESFLQVNSEQTEKLYALALEFASLRGEEHVVDAYCGIGTLSLLFAQKAERVTGIEIVARAVEDARTNAARNGMSNAIFTCAAAEEELAQMAQKAQRVDVLVLDPPRKGCDAALLEAAGRLGPARIVYVSCDCATLARDCKLLGEQDYKVTRVQGVDMFPQTTHVETVALLERA